MKILKGSHGIDFKPLQETKAAIEQVYVKEKAVIDQRRDELNYSEKNTVLPPQDSAFWQKLMDGCGERITMSEFKNILGSASDQIRAADRQLYRLRDGLQAIGSLPRDAGALPQNIDAEQLNPWKGRTLGTAYKAALRDISSIISAYQAVGPVAVADEAPIDALRQLQEQLHTDLDTIHEAFPDISAITGRFRRKAPKNTDPQLGQLPATRALTTKHVQEIEDIGNYLSQALGQDFTAQIQKAHQKCKDPEAFLELIGGFAILADEATHAPDYAGGARGGQHRQQYRARQHAGGHSRFRQEESRAALQKDLQEVLGSRRPLVNLEKKLTEAFIRETGAQELLPAGIKPDPIALSQAIKEEAFLPLRGLIELGPNAGHHKHKAGAQTQKVLGQIAKSIIEGNYHDWRQGHEASQQQLSILDPEQRALWMETHQSEHDLKSQEGAQRVVTKEVHNSFDIFWATKVGGPSHGFDVGPDCTLSVLTNARNIPVVVDDPRWENYSGRTYIRLVSDPETEKPMLFLESMTGDFPYPGDTGDLEALVVQHAMEKAQKLGIPLVVSESAYPTLEAMDLSGTWKKGQMTLEPALLFEASSPMGRHDWVQTERETVRMSKALFHVNMEQI